MLIATPTRDALNRAPQGETSVAQISELALGTRVRYYYFSEPPAPAKHRDGVVTGRRMKGHTEGQIDPDGDPGVDRVKVTFDPGGSRADDTSISCAPSAVDVLHSNSPPP